MLVNVTVKSQNSFDNKQPPQNIYTFAMYLTHLAFVKFKIEEKTKDKKQENDGLMYMIPECECKQLAPLLISASNNFLYAVVIVIAHCYMETIITNADMQRRQWFAFAIMRHSYNTTTCNSFVFRFPCASHCLFLFSSFFFVSGIDPLLKIVAC